MIRVRLLTGLSTNNIAPGELFKSHVASDVVQDGKVLIPAGAEIDGHVVEVSEGHTGGHGSIRLRPDTVILLDGQRYRMDAQVTGTPGSKTRVNSEGTINAGSRWKRDGYRSPARWRPLPSPRRWAWASSPPRWNGRTARSGVTTRPLASSRGW